MVKRWGIIISVLAIICVGVIVGIVLSAAKALAPRASGDFDSIKVGMPLANAKAILQTDNTPEAQPDGSTLYYVIYADGTREIDVYVMNNKVSRVLRDAYLHRGSTANRAPPVAAQSGRGNSGPLPTATTRR